MNLFNRIFNTQKQVSASKIFNVLDYDDSFINIVCSIEGAKDYSDMQNILKAIENFKIRYQNNSKVKDDATDLENRLEARFEMLEAAGL